MPQHPLTIANGAGNVVRAAINDALAALGSTQKGPTAPTGAAAGWVWVDDNTPSATLWTVFMYDGTDWIRLGFLDTTNNRFTAEGSPIWAGTAGGTANALTLTTTPAPTARFPGLQFTFIVASTNTGAATLNDNSLGAQAIRRPDNGVLLAADLLAGDMVTVIWDGSLWRLTRWPADRVLLDRKVANNSATIDFTLPAGFGRYRFEVDQVRPVTDGTEFVMRTSTDGGSSFAFGASDYVRVVEATNPGTNNVDAASTTGSGMTLISALDNTTSTHHASGSVDFTPGDGSRLPKAQSSFDFFGEAITNWQLQRGVTVRASATPVNAVRFQMISGNISIGTFRFYGIR